MHIPRQPDGSREHAPRRPGHPTGGPGPAAGDVPGPAVLGADGLRDARRRLVTQQRALAYWQRLVQARVDLVVAGLLYGAPVPSARSYPPGLPDRAGRDVGDAALPGAGRGPEDLQALACPPEGLDVEHLLGGAPTGPDGPGEHLGRLRLAAGLLARRRRTVDEELDAVTLALHDRLALDGDGARSRLAATGAEALDPA